MEIRKWAGILAALALILGGSGAALAAGGTITGKVLFSGAAPQPKKMKIDKDKERCGAEMVSEELVVGADKGVQWAVVSVVGAKASPPANPPHIDQNGCKFNPRVAVVSPGANLDILNNDKILHNIHTYSKKNQAINKAHPKFRKKLTEKFAQTEIIKLTCDVHTWMLGWIVVSDAPTAVTDKGGAFTLTNVPPGNYSLKMWHEKLGEQTKQVTVKAGAETKVSFELR